MKIDELKDQLAELYKKLDENVETYRRLWDYIPQTGNGQAAKEVAMKQVRQEAEQLHEEVRRLEGALEVKTVDLLMKSEGEETA